MQIEAHSQNALNSCSRNAPASVPINCHKWDGRSPSGPAAEAELIPLIAAVIDSLSSIIAGLGGYELIVPMKCEPDGCFLVTPRVFVDQAPFFYLCLERVSSPG